MATTGIDFQLFDSGQAVASLRITDAAGLDTTWPTDASPLVWVSSDPGLTVSGSTDGMSAIVSPSVPPVKLTGATVTVKGTLADGTVISGSSEMIDVVGGVAGKFIVTLH